MRRSVFICAVLLLVTPIVASAGEPLALKAVALIMNINKPTAVTHAGDGSGRLFVLEQPGRVLTFTSNEHRVYAHPSVLQPILRHPGVVRSGVSAAADYSIDIIAEEAGEAYVRSSEVEDLVERFALDEAADRPNLILRVVDDDAWPFDAGEGVAPPLVAAVDLLEADDERSRRAGADLLERQ